jgi:hypothetical protein
MQPSVARRIVGVYEAAGGLLGVALSVFVIPSALARVPEHHRGGLLVFIGVSLTMFALLGLAGILLLHHHRLGAGLTAALQIAQVPMWSALGTSWIFTTGPYIGPAWSHAGLGLSFGLKLQWFAQVRGGGPPDWGAINLVPLAMLFLLRVALHGSSDPVGTSARSTVTTPHTPSVAPPA